LGIERTSVDFLLQTLVVLNLAFLLVGERCRSLEVRVRL
jgi:hypothetical protein